jgi:hypothetical protein
LGPQSTPLSAPLSHYFGAALLLLAGAADDVSDGAGPAELGEFGGGLSPPHAAAMAPIAAMAARSATTAIFFIIVFSSKGPEATPPLCPSYTFAVNHATF